jgi:hypothetical protein
MPVAIPVASPPGLTRLPGEVAFAPLAILAELKFAESNDLDGSRTCSIEILVGEKLPRLAVSSIVETRLRIIQRSQLVGVYKKSFSQVQTICWPRFRVGPERASAVRLRITANHPAGVVHP